MIFGLGQVFPEALCGRCESTVQSHISLRENYPLQRFLDAHLLCIHEATHRNLYREVNVIRSNVFPQCHLCTSFCHSYHAFKMAHRDWVRTRGHRLAPQIRKEL